ncbi:MAG TPA: hypothetical protein VFP81_12380 [Propionibacteriaceae bacterium]|nr:hypothetical protein [Propionibacteriaceae bacterium]
MEAPIMRKAMITKAIVGSLVGYAGAVVLSLVAGGLALWNDSLIMNGAANIAAPRNGA